MSLISPRCLQLVGWFVGQSPETGHGIILRTLGLTLESQIAVKLKGYLAPDDSAKSPSVRILNPATRARNEDVGLPDDCYRESDQPSSVRVLPEMPGTPVRNMSVEGLSDVR